MVVSAAVRSDIDNLAGYIESLPIGVKAILFSHLSDTGLMKTRNLFVRACFALVKKIRGNTRSYMVGLAKKRPDIIEELIKQSADHMRHGRDTEDRNSVGGFSQREINQILYVLGLEGST